MSPPESLKKALSLDSDIETLGLDADEAIKLKSVRATSAPVPGSVMCPRKALTTALALKVELGDLHPLQMLASHSAYKTYIFHRFFFVLRGCSLIEFVKSCSRSDERWQPGLAINNTVNSPGANTREHQRPAER